MSPYNFILGSKHSGNPGKVLCYLKQVIILRYDETYDFSDRSSASADQQSGGRATETTGGASQDGTDYPEPTEGSGPAERSSEASRNVSNDSPGGGETADNLTFTV